MNRRFLGLLGATLLAGGVVLGLVFRDVRGARAEFARQGTLATVRAARIPSELLLYSKRRIAAGLTLSQTLAGLGAQPVLAASIINSAQGVFDLRRLQAGHSLEIGRSASGELRAIRYQVDADRMLSVQASGEGFHAELQPIPVQLGTITITGQVNDSLFRAVADAGEDAELAMRLAEIFSWDLDFYTDTRRGDSFRVVIEKKLIWMASRRATGESWRRNTTTTGTPTRRCCFMTRTARRHITPPTARPCRRRFSVPRLSLPRRSPPISAGAGCTQS